MEKDHYTVIYFSEPGNTRIKQICCNYCDYWVSWLEVKATKSGHKWPRMSHNIKQHLRDKHEINLYKKGGRKRSKDNIRRRAISDTHITIIKKKGGN